MLTYFVIGMNVVISYLAYKAFSENDRVDRFLFQPFALSRGRNIKGAILSNFSHAGFFHFLFNMITLYYFGPVVEKLGGKIAFIIVYVASGLTSMLFSYYRHKDDYSYRALGASGCVSGVLLASTVMYPQMSVYFFFIPVPIPAPAFAILFILASYYFMESSESHIAHDAHLGGALAGFVLGGVFAPKGFNEFFNFFLRMLK